MSKSNKRNFMKRLVTMLLVTAMVSSAMPVNIVADVQANHGHALLLNEGFIAVGEVEYSYPSYGNYSESHYGGYCYDESGSYPDHGNDDEPPYGDTDDEDEGYPGYGSDSKPPYGDRDYNYGEYPRNSGVHIEKVALGSNIVYFNSPTDLMLGDVTITYPSSAGTPFAYSSLWPIPRDVWTTNPERVASRNIAIGLFNYSIYQIGVRNPETGLFTNGPISGWIPDPEFVVLDIGNLFPDEGIYQKITMQVSSSSILGNPIWVHINIQRAHAFVEVDGIMDEPETFVLDPETIRVGRPSFDTHGEYTFTWTIFDEWGNEVTNGSREDGIANIYAPSIINVAGLDLLPGRYTIVNVVEEFPHGIFPNCDTLIAEAAGAFEISETPTFTVSYNVTGAAPATHTALPSPQTIAADTTGVVIAPILTTTETTNEDGIAGTWTFNGWATEDVTVVGDMFTMPNNDVEFTGYWTFTSDTFDVTYAVTGTRPATYSGMPTSPQSVAAGTEDVMVAAIPATTETTNAAGIAGTWTFNGWNHSTITGPAFTMPNNDVEFTGCWTFTADTFDVTYAVTGTRPATYSGMPTSPQSVAAGTEDVTVAAILTTTETTNAAGISGTWAFNGWNHPTITGPTFTMPNNDVEFTGYWTFTADTFDVSYTVTGTRPATYSGMPTSPQSVAAGTEDVTVAAIPTTTETTNAAGIAGTWTFNGWNHSTITGSAFTMPNNDVEFTGYWTFVPDTILHTVTFTAAAGGTINPGPTHSVQVESGEHLTTAQIPIPQPNTGYRFLGWFVVGVAVTPTANPITGNIIFEARFERITGGGGGGNGGSPNYNLVINKSADTRHGDRVIVGETVTYTISVRNSGSASSGRVVITDIIPTGMTLVSGSAITRVNGVVNTAITPTVSGGTLAWTITSIAAGATVEVSFQVTVNSLPAGVYERVFRNTAIVNNRNTNTVELTTRQLIKNSDRMSASVGEAINWTLRGFHNPTGRTVADFAIIDLPSLGLNFQSGSIPAFNNGSGVTYDIRYMITGSNEWRTHTTNVDASRPFTFSLPQPGNLHYTNIGLFFGNVPAGFGLGNEIVYTFIVGDGAPSNVLTNRFLIMFDDTQLEGSSPDRPVVNGPGEQGSLGGPGGLVTSAPIPAIPFSPMHHAYIIGDNYGMLRPSASITRAEVATIFFRLITDEHRALVWSQTNTFSDVEIDNWFNNAISTMTNAGVLEGMPDGTFQPNRAITRGEFAAAMTRFFEGLPFEGENIFPDVEGHWAALEINAAARMGWVTGYPDGTFAPNQSITRAETAAVINRILKRLPEGPEDLLPDMIIWPDNMNPDAWYYLYIQEATNSNYYVRKADGIHKTWTALMDPRDWRILERPDSSPWNILDR